MAESTQETEIQSQNAINTYQCNDKSKNQNYVRILSALSIPVFTPPGKDIQG